MRRAAGEIVEEGVESGELGVEDVEDARGETGEDVEVVDGNEVAHRALEGEPIGVRQRQLCMHIADDARRPCCAPQFLGAKDRRRVCVPG